jgi:micrococcal nuclease
MSLSKISQSIFIVLCCLSLSVSVQAKTSTSLYKAQKTRSGPYQLNRIADGDTITVTNKAGAYTTVRLIGIDAPEIAHGRKPAECGGQSAKDYITELLGDSAIYLQSDPSQDMWDKYHRKLAYVYAGDTLVNRAMVADGYAYEYTYKKPHQYQSTFRKLQTNAQNQNLGIWADKCRAKNNGDRNRRF